MIDKKALIVFLPFFLLFGGLKAQDQYSGTGSNPDSEYVEGYYKDDGTYVEGYYRTESNNYNLDNYSAEGNYNPHTGEYGNKLYDQPYNSYESSGSYEMNFNTNNSYDYDMDFDTDYSSPSFN